MDFRHRRVENDSVYQRPFTFTISVSDAVQKLHPGQKEEVIRNHIAAKLYMQQQSERRKTSRKNEENDKQ